MLMWIQTILYSVCVFSCLFQASILAKTCTDSSEIVVDNGNAVRELEAGTSVMIKCCIKKRPNSQTLTWTKLSDAKKAQVHEEVPSLFARPPSSSSSSFPSMYTVPYVSSGKDAPEILYLVVNNFQNEAHSGTYACQAGSDSHVTLEITQRSDQLHVTAPESYLFRVGDPAGRLECRVQFASSDFRVSWFFQGNYLAETADDEQSRHYSHSDNGQVLELSPVKESDEGQYLCKAELVNSQFIRILQVHVRVYRIPEILPDSPSQSSKVAKEGEELELKCEADGVPRPRITWLKNGDALISQSGGEEGSRVKVSSSAVNPTRQTSVLTVQQVNWLDAGNYSCVAYLQEKEDGVAVNVSKNIHPRIVVQPHFLKETVLDAEVDPGQGVKLECHVIGGTEGDLDVKMYHNNRWLDPQKENNRFTLTTLPLPLGKWLTLSIENAVSEDGGMYECRATTDHSSRKKAGTVMIRSAPVVSTTQETVLAIPYTTTTLSCNASLAQPAPLWHWNRGTVGLDEAQYQQVPPANVPSLTSQLIIAGGHRDIYGTYECTAKNMAGQHSTQIHVIKANRPSQPNVTQCGVGPTWAVFCFTTPQTNSASSASLEPSYMQVRYRKLDDFSSFDYTQPIQSQVRVEHLLPNQDYHFAFSLVSPAGRSTSSGVKIKTLPMQNPDVTVMEAPAEEVGSKTYPLRWRVDDSIMGSAVSLQDYVVRVSKVKDDGVVAASRSFLQSQPKDEASQERGGTTREHRMLLRSLSPATKYRLCVTARGEFTSGEEKCIEVKTAEGNTANSLLVSSSLQWTLFAVLGAFLLRH